MKKSLLRDALRIAIKEIPNHPEHDHYMHWSFLVQGKIIDWATNDSGDAPIHLGYNERVSWSKAKRHSEFNIHRKAKGLIIPGKKFEIINIRLNRRGEVKNSAPCSCCYNFLKDLGTCSHCYFTTDQGIWAKTIF